MTKNQNTYPARAQELITLEVAHRAFLKFAEEFWNRDGKHADGLQRLLSFNSHNVLGFGPADAAQWSDWLNAVDIALTEKRQKEH